jgi:hypothetical protein
MSDTQEAAANPAADTGTGGNFAPGAKSNPMTPEALIADFAAKIIEAGRGSVTSILDRGLWCAKADEKLNQGEQKKLVAVLPIDQSTFSRFAQIGKNLHRLNAIKDQLMASYSTIYIIATMEDAEFEAAMKVEGLISPGDEALQDRGVARGLPQSFADQGDRGRGGQCGRGGR